jgi:hypothetical protein
MQFLCRTPDHPVNPSQETVHLFKPLRLSKVADDRRRQRGVPGTYGISRLTQDVGPIDTVGRFETKFCPKGKPLVLPQVLRGFDHRLIDQQHRDIVAYRVDSAALGAFEALAVRLERERLLAKRADQNVKQFLRNHGKTFYAKTLEGHRLQ